MHHRRAIKIPKGKFEVKKPNCELFFILFLVAIEQGEGYKGVGMSKFEENESKSKKTK